VLPWGGDLITEDISIGLNISLEHAESLKTKYGSSLSKEIDVKEIVLIPGIAGRKPTPISAKNLAIIIEERIRELSAAIWVEIAKIADPESLKAGIVIVGGGAQLPDISETIQKNTGIETRIGEPNERAQSIQLEEEMNTPEFASAIGLINIFYQQIEIPTELEIEETEISEERLVYQSPTKEPAKPKEPKVNFKKFLDRVVEVVMGNDDDVSKEW
jgi:cell division protein FtsA